MIRVLVAEDSHAARLLIVTLLEGDPDIEVVGEVSDGEAAVAGAKRLRPDVITMDIHMPVLDGLEATARIMNEVPTPIVVVSSTVSAQDVASSFAAMKAGALVALPKPGASNAGLADADRQAFVSTIKAMASVKVVRRWSGAYVTVVDRAGAPPERQDGAGAVPVPHQFHAGRITVPLEAANRAPPRSVSLVAIAASTGGPTALQRILSELPATFPAPIVIVQHIARGFLTGFASWLDGECAIRVKVAARSERLEAGTAYVAADDVHLGVSPNRTTLTVPGGEVNGFRPSGSVLFESAADSYGSSLAAVILTGMGSDGVSGLRRVRATGGYVIAQDEESSLIYGMPGESVKAGVVDISLPLDLIAAHLQRVAAR